MILLSKILEKLYHPSLSTIHSEEYGSVESIGSRLTITHTKNGKLNVKNINLDNTAKIEDQVKKEVKKIFQLRHKLVAASFSEKTSYKHLAPKLWLDEDIVSFLLKDRSNNETISVKEDIRRISSNFDTNHAARIQVSKDYEVQVKDLISLDDYKKTCSGEEFSTLLSLSNEFKNKSLLFISATPQGGGVAIMRHAMIRLYKLLDVDVHWYVLKPNLEAFNITKRKFHNILQAVADPKMELNQKDKEIYNSWIKENAALFEDRIKKFDVVVIDDPQPSGLIPYIKKSNPKSKVIYRSHIQIEAKLVGKENTPQYKTWKFLWRNIRLSDVFVAHPVTEFIPDDVDKKRVVFMPATTDPLDGLNKPLEEHHLTYYLYLFNKFLKEEGQTPLNLKRPYIIQIARFDPSKGISHALESYLKLTKLLKENGKKVPYLIITGNGSIDDPDRAPIFEQTMKDLNSPKYKEIKNDIKVVRLPHVDQLLNTILRKSKVVLQLSTKEGFEIKVTEALMKGKPVIVYRTGGMPLQVKDKVNSFVVDVGKTDEVARHLFDLLTNDWLYSSMSAAAQNYYDKSLLTIPNAIRWLKISISLINKDK